MVFENGFWIRQIKNIHLKYLYKICTKLCANTSNNSCDIDLNIWKFWPFDHVRHTWGMSKSKHNLKKILVGIKKISFDVIALV